VRPSRPSSASNRSTRGLRAPALRRPDLPDFFFQRCTSASAAPRSALRRPRRRRGAARPSPTPHAAPLRTCMGPAPSASSTSPTTALTASARWSRRLRSLDRRFRRAAPAVVDHLRMTPTALDIAAMNRLSWNADVRFIPVRCLGSVNVIWIKTRSPRHGRRFSHGMQARGRLPVPLRQGQRAGRYPREENRRGLSSLALEPERVAQFQVAIDEYDKIPGSFRSLGHHRRPRTEPFKGF